MFRFGISKLFFLLFDTSRLAKRFFINTGFTSFNVLKVSRAKVLSVLASIVHLLLFSVKFCSRFHSRLKEILKPFFCIF